MNRLQNIAKTSNKVLSLETQCFVKLFLASLLFFILEKKGRFLKNFFSYITLNVCLIFFGNTVEFSKKNLKEICLKFLGFR